MVVLFIYIVYLSLFKGTIRTGSTLNVVNNSYAIFTRHFWIGLRKDYLFEKAFSTVLACG